MAEEPTTTTVPDLSLEFVSKLVGRKVSSFTIKPGTAPGDNYMSVLYCIKCIVDEYNVIYTISKCYPTHPMRQQFLNKSNIFWNELHIYKDLIPTLRAFQEENGVKLKLPFAQLISGEAVNFGKGKENVENLAGKYAGQVFGPFDNFLMMVDLKNTYGFRMANRLVGLDVNEVSLVMSEHSKLHALSWAFKLKNGIQDISEKFPFMEFKMMEEDMTMWKGMMDELVQSGLDTLKSIDGVNPAIFDGISKFKDNMEDILKGMFGDKDDGPLIPMENFLRVKMDKDEATRLADSVPWKVVIHGDCWINNLLFHYDEVTKKAVELVLIDLQMMRDACPTMDLVYLIYTSTTAEFRRKHLDDMLKLYCTKFMSYCDQYGVEYLPGFSFEALKRRFHVSKLLGLTMAFTVLSAILKDAKDIQDLDQMKMEVGADLVDMFKTVMGNNEGNALYKARLLGVVQDLYNDGVI